MSEELYLLKMYLIAMDFKNLYEYAIYKQEFCLFIGKCINFIYNRNVLFHGAMKITAQNFY